MKTVGIILVILALVAIVWQIKSGVSSYYEYNKDILSYWNLSDKSSTIPEKSKYIKQFVAALEKSKHSDYDAVFLTTPDNSFVKNIEALKSLEKRLSEIQDMKVTSPEYQWAIQQITAQEQGEAKKMLDIFDGCWTKENYAITWNWIAFLFSISYIFLLIIGGCLIAVGIENE